MQIESITYDGHRAILKAIRIVLPDVVLQCCLIHLQKDYRIWLTKNPQSNASYDLKQITSKLHSINTRYDLGLWLLK